MLNIRIILHSKLLKRLRLKLSQLFVRGMLILQEPRNIILLTLEMYLNVQAPERLQ